MRQMIVNGKRILVNDPPPPPESTSRPVETTPAVVPPAELRPAERQAERQQPGLLERLLAYLEL